MPRIAEQLGADMIAIITRIVNALLATGLVVFLPSATVQAAQPMKFSIAAVSTGQGEANVTITITNTGDSVLIIPMIQPQSLVTLIVRDRNNRILMPTPVVPQSSSIGAMFPERLQPGHTYTLTDSNGSANLGLSRLGYAGLESGTYSLSVQPGIVLGGSDKPQSSLQQASEVSTASNTVLLKIGGN